MPPSGADMVIARFYTVGLVCALAHNAIIIGGDWVGLHYALSSLISFVTTVPLGYWLHSAWTFPGTERNPVTFARYTLTMAMNLPLFVAGMFVLADLAGMPVAIASPLMTVLVAAFNFIGGRWALRWRR